MKKTILILTVAACSVSHAQEPVTVGKGSYAPYPPTYKAQTAEHAGFQATKMLTRKLYVDETDRSGNPRPIPTNDWWTDVINNQYSGALWSYPAMIKTGPEGVTVAYPTYWYENGTEVKTTSNLTVGGVKYTASEARAADWHDWDVEISLPSETDPNKGIMATLAHGIPFTWFEFNSVIPQMTFSTSPEIINHDNEGVMLRIGEDLYGLYYPDGTTLSMADGAMTLNGATWLSVGLLQSDDDFEGFAPYATSIVRDTRVDWQYDEQTSTLGTSWTVTAENLRDAAAPAPVMQGFLPHVWKHALNSTIPYNGICYLTPRGTMKMAAATNGRFEYAYRFSGMLPWYAAPVADDSASTGYKPDRMKELMQAYAAGGGFGGDTYWGGKGLTQMALNMTFAKETGETEIYQTAKKRLRDALVNWLTYTPGENTMFFSYYPRWGGMLGFDVSYDSDAFNDHHFHYGYFIFAGALLCLEDESFKAGYGQLLKMIAQDYANYDRTDSRFPFLRTLDPWAGHSYAGGLGDHGNDNGNGQESSSEAMQGWGGVYMLGVALGDRELRDAGIFGWMTESRGTVEYWFDRDHIHPGKEHNYDYTLYQSPYNTNLTSKGIGWWTWFSGDPLWMHSIQWMPVSPCLNYLSEDLDFVKWDYETMRGSTAYSWFEKSGTEAPLADQSVGNVVLCYMERYDPQGAAEVFDTAWDKGLGIAKGIDTGHISYYVIHSHLTYGDIDFEVTADCPTANAYRKAESSMTYMVYNPDAVTREVKFYRNGSVEKIVNAPSGKLTVFSDAPRPTSLIITSEQGLILPPGIETSLSAVLYDQYGAEIEGETLSWSVYDGATISSDGMIHIPANTPKGSTLTVYATAAGIPAEIEIEVNDPPVITSAVITGVPDFIETGISARFGLQLTDQYGKVTYPDAEWSVSDPDNYLLDVCDGEVTFINAGRHTLTAAYGSSRAQASVIVLPPLPDITANATAFSSSEENVGTKTEYAIDGDTGTRWGSAHSDDQWFMLDLGGDYRIASVTINWEAAYAADYDIDILHDGADPHADMGWVTAYTQRGLSSPGVIRHSVAATGRYVKVRCLRRATNYGYSIIEIGIGGLSVTAGDNAVAGIEIVAPLLMNEGKPAEIDARLFNVSGDILPAGNINWHSDPAGEFVGNSFTPLSYGNYTLTATVGNFSATKNILVEESVKLASLNLSPTRLSLLTDETGHIDVEGVNQFGGIYPVSNESLAVTVKDSDGKPVSTAIAAFNTATGEFTASRRGDYVIDFGGKATVEITVRDVAEANLAAGKSARASSSIGGNTPGKVTDLDLSTRWESQSNDQEWIAIDLENRYILDRVVIHWEGAYASSYAIETSMDGVNWFEVYTTSTGKGKDETVTLPDVPASHIRIYCHKRATVYGNSIFEVEVYGKSRFEAVNNGTKPSVDKIEYQLGNGSVDGTIIVSHPEGLTLFSSVSISRDRSEGNYCVSGIGNEIPFSFDGLKTGLYNLNVVTQDPFGNTSHANRQLNIIYSSAGINLALNKPAEATSSENEANLHAGLAVDGDLETRWGSRFNDDEALTVDLTDNYLVNNVKIHWNTPAYANRYSVETSLDGVNYNLVHGREDWAGGVDDSLFDPTPARYIRVTGHNRATPYGTSINELEVYGNDLTSDIDLTLADDINGNVSSHIKETAPVNIYSIDGRLIISELTLAEARRLLSPGIYFVTDGNSHIKLRL
ncbi:MAG: discoidin domain-containing protein [Muribaculaceae bacterium]|nr:discoidin domain-containing protein [Muribaculaceae bacterium]